MRVREAHALIRRVRVPRAFLVAGIVAGVIALGSTSRRPQAGAPQSSSLQAGPETPANGILARRNPSDDLPKPNTPQQWGSDIVNKTLVGAGQVLDRGLKEGGRVYHTGGDPNLNLIESARSGDIEQMRAWLDKGADANAVDPYASGNLETPLMCAVRSGNPEAVRLLLTRVSEAGKKAQNRGNATALTIARSLRNGAATVEEGRRFREIEQALVRVGVPD